MQMLCHRGRNMIKARKSFMASQFSMHRRTSKSRMNLRLRRFICKFLSGGGGGEGSGGQGRIQREIRQ